MFEASRPFRVTALRNAPANLPHLTDDDTDPAAIGKPLVIGFNTSLDFQVNWSGLTAASSGTQVTVEASNGGEFWQPKSGCGSRLTGASGGINISLGHEVLNQELYRLKYSPGAASDGVVNVVVFSR